MIDASGPGHLIDQLRITDTSGVSVAKLDRWYAEVHASDVFKTGVATHATWWTAKFLKRLSHAALWDLRGKVTNLDASCNVNQFKST